MKKLSILAAAAFAALPFAGCVNDVGVVNPYNTTAQWNSIGFLTTKYPGKTIDEVFQATIRGLDQLYGGTSRVGEHRPKPKEPYYEVYARVVGDIKITVKIVTARDAKTKEQWTEATVSYGTWGNLQESQKIVAAISRNL